MSHRFPSLPNIESLINGEGEITIGQLGPFTCTATANDECQALAMLVRHNDETLEQLLMRLEMAVEKAVEEQIFIAEINNGPDGRI